MDASKGLPQDLRLGSDPHAAAQCRMQSETLHETAVKLEIVTARNMVAEAKLNTLMRLLQEWHDSCDSERGKLEMWSSWQKRLKLRQETAKVLAK